LWLDLERAIVKPEVIVALGATAARSLTGRPVTLAKVRGETLRTTDGSPLIVTIHPSFLLRLRDDESKEREYARLVADLRTCTRLLRKAA